MKTKKRKAIKKVYSAEELRRIQSIEAEALKIIDDICEKNNIEYFLIGGSALGAIRHNGFIPWDDDIDIGMTRSNYKFFLENAPRFLPKGYYLQTPYSDFENPYFYSKLRIDGTKFVEYCNHRLDIHHGIYVDIFPFDEVPDNEKLNIKQFQRIQFLIRLFQLRQSPDVCNEPDTLILQAKSSIRRILHFLVQVIPLKVLKSLIEREFTRYNLTGQKALACLNFPVRKTEYILRSDLYPLQFHVFEGELRPIPCNIGKYLETHYGDYMKLPPVEERFGHKPYLIDLGNLN